MDLDNLLAGLQDSELIVVAARPGVGKTSLAAEVVRRVGVEQGHPVFVASLEQSRGELTARILCAAARVDSQLLRRARLRQEEAERLLEASGPHRKSPVFIDDAPNQSMLRITATARRFKLCRGLRLVVVDYLQLVEPDSRREPRHEQVAGISRRLKQLARELAVPVVALCQLNRASEESQRPKLSHLRESGAIEADADTVILMHKTEEEPGVVELIVAKQRNGPTGEVKLAFDRRLTRFENYAPMPATWGA